MTNAYDAWQTAKAALAGREIAEGLRNALELSVAALREPAKIARVSALLRTYDAVQEGGPYDEADGVWAWRDSAAAQIAVALEEFEQTAPALTDLRRNLAQATKEALDLLACKNWTGDNTYGEAIEDMHQVLSAVFAGRDFPTLDRFRCPSLVGNDIGAGRVCCGRELPHEGRHQLGGLSWTDEEALNPPKPRDEAVPLCGAPGYQFTCSLLEGHKGSHSHNGITWDLAVGGEIKGGGLWQA